MQYFLNVWPIYRDMEKKVEIVILYHSTDVSDVCRYFWGYYKFKNVKNMIKIFSIGALRNSFRKKFAPVTPWKVQ